MSGSKSLFLISILLAFFSNAQQVDTIKVKVHDHVMTLYSSGNGKPTVILEAGGGSSHKETWEKVEAQLASFTKVVSYDRPGYLNSEKCNSTRDAVTVAKELKEALTKSGIKPPYILAGWSLGGSFVRVFAGLYPQDVSGLVLVDPAPENSYPLYEKDPTYLADKKAHHDRLMSSNRVGQKGEWLAFDSSMNQGRRSDAWHATPTTLLIAAGKADGGQDRDTTDPLNRIWVEELIKWGKKRPNMKYEIISNSGHHIARFQPDIVVNAIRYHIDQYQSKALKQSATSYKKLDQLNDGIQTATLKEAGLNEKILQTMVDSIANGNYPRIHSVLILRNNKLVFEQYWPGYDVVRGKGFVGFTDQHRDSLHDQRSVSKSFVGTAIMIALNQGKIKSLEQRVFDLFPEYAKYDTGMKKQITIQHLLNMSAGLEWNENIPYTDPKNSEIVMNNSTDAIDFVLSQTMIDEPGKKFNYSGGCSQVLAAIAERATGMPVDKFLASYLFKPLGIEKYTWFKIADGKPSAASGLRLRSRDMAKYGLMYMNDGKWNGKQIVSSSIVTQTLKSQITTPDTYPGVPQIGYSNQFWIITEVNKADTITYAQCQGNGGQLIIHDKKHNLLLIVTAGNYNRWDLRKSSFDIYTDFVYPAIMK
ncbi:alpha/beta fold hydrolase [Lacibacter sp.]|uniref:alpha/beta fold hydrolase n=1 Tax=Lacibacter sp. TaxID=1915409 RepID=UPI002B4B05DA|nr:alpha/beta fold hydrolase [Lacibacter sp.]